MKVLHIDGKKVSIEKIAEKSLAQFRAQIKQVGLEISDERLESIYKSLRHEEITEEEKTAIKAEAERKAEEAKAAALAKVEQLKKGK